MSLFWVENETGSRVHALQNPRFDPPLQKNAPPRFLVFPWWESYSDTCLNKVVVPGASAWAKDIRTCFGAFWPRWTAESQSIAFNLPSLERHTNQLPSEMYDILWVRTWRLPRREARPLLGEAAEVVLWQILLTEQVGESRAVVRNHPYDSQLLPWSPDKKIGIDLSTCSPTERAVTALNIWRPASSRQGKGSSVGKQLSCLLAFQFELSIATDEKVLTPHGGKDTATAKHCPHGGLREWPSPRC